MSAKTPRFPPPRSQSNPLEALAIGALGAMVVVVVELWLTGELSGRVFGGTWPHTPFGEMPQVLGRFRQHVADPAKAWPRTDRRLIPGATAFYVTMLATVAPLVVGAASSCCVADPDRGALKPALLVGRGNRIYGCSESTSLTQDGSRWAV